MNKTDIKKLVKDMHVHSAVVINQITRKITVPDDLNELKLITRSVNERGLSRSRNRAINESSADICLIADDDMYYADNYENTVTDAYKAYPDADIITFYVDHEDKNQTKKKQRRGRLSLIETMKVSSCQISFKLSSVTEHDLQMDMRFGAGTENYMCEENIFLFEAIKRGLRIYSVPEKIATLKDSGESTWFTGYDEKFFYIKGRAFRRMSRLLAPILIVQFIIRKHSLYKQELNIFIVTKVMLKGMRHEAKYGK
jgi:glycosyltransferase involved in cell wall biosynthesis